MRLKIETSDKMSRDSESLDVFSAVIGWKTFELGLWRSRELIDAAGGGRVGHWGRILRVIGRGSFEISVLHNKHSPEYHKHKQDNHAHETKRLKYAPINSLLNQISNRGMF